MDSDNSPQTASENKDLSLRLLYPRLRPNLFANCSSSGCIQFFITDRINMIWNSRGKYSGALIGPIKSGSYSDILFSLCRLTLRQLDGHRRANRKKTRERLRNILGKISADTCHRWWNFSHTLNEVSTSKLLWEKSINNTKRPLLVFSVILCFSTKRISTLFIVSWTP